MNTAIIHCCFTGDSPQLLEANCGCRPGYLRPLSFGTHSKGQKSQLSFVVIKPKRVMWVIIIVWKMLYNYYYYDYLFYCDNLCLTTLASCQSVTFSSTRWTISASISPPAALILLEEMADKRSKEPSFLPPIKNSLMVATVIKTWAYWGLGNYKGTIVQDLHEDSWQKLLRIYLSVRLASFFFTATQHALRRVLSDFRAGENALSVVRRLDGERNKRPHSSLPCTLVVSVTAFPHDNNLAVD